MPIPIFRYSTHRVSWRARKCGYKSLKMWNLSREKVRSIKCYLTGYEQDDGTYNVCRYGFSDKHGFGHMVYNAKVNLHRANGSEIFLDV